MKLFPTNSHITMNLAERLNLPMTPEFYNNLGAKSVKRGNAAQVGEEIRGGALLDRTKLHKYTHLYNSTYISLHLCLYLLSINIYMRIIGIPRGIYRNTW